MPSLHLTNLALPLCSRLTFTTVHFSYSLIRFYFFFLLMIGPPPRSPLFPYTTLFRSLPLQRCERQLEQRTRARDRFRAAGQAYNRCGHCFLLKKRSAATRIEESRPITVRRFGAGARVVYLILSRMPTRLTVRSPYNTWSSKRGNTSAW